MRSSLLSCVLETVAGGRGCSLRRANPGAAAQRPTLRRGNSPLGSHLLTRPSRGISGFSKIGPGHQVAQPSNPLPGAPGVERTQIVGGPPHFTLSRFNHSGEGAKRPLAAGPGHPSPLPPGPELPALIRRTRKKAPGALLRTRQPK